jgi:hypothetical protein
MKTVCPAAICPGKNRFRGRHGRRERGLLHLGKVVFGISVKLEYADLNERKFLVLPDLCDVERVFIVIFCLLSVII